MPLFAPHRFSMVDEGIYRGGYPTTRNMRFLKRLNLKTTISLCPTKPTIFEGQLTASVTDHDQSQPTSSSSSINEGTVNHHFKIKKPKESSITLTLPEIYAVLQILKQKSNYPIYIHCVDGTQITNVICMCFRKSQGWDMNSIINEASKFSKEEISDEIAFVEAINVNEREKRKEEVVKEEDPEVAGYSRTIFALDLEMN